MFVVERRRYALEVVDADIKNYPSLIDLYSESHAMPDMWIIPPLEGTHIVEETVTEVEAGTGKRTVRSRCSWYDTNPDSVYEAEE